MATRYLARSLLTTRQSFAFVFSHSFATSAAAIPNSSSFLFRLRPLVAAASASYFRRLVPAISTRAFSTRPTTSSLSDPNPNWSNRPPKETILLDGCDFEHWLVVVEKPEGDPTRDEIIDSYIKTLAKVVGSEEEARMKIYSVSTRHYFAFGALVSEELSYRLKELPGVRWVLPDSYLDVKNKDYGGEPFINGQAVPYDPKYHEEWVRNNARANERNRRNDRPKNFDRSRNFERRREMQGPNSGPNSSGPGGNYGGQPNMPPPQPNPPMGGPGQPNPPMGGPGQPNPPMGGTGQPNPPMGGTGQPNPHMGGPGQPNYGGGMPPNNYPPRGPAPNQFGPGPNSGGASYHPAPGPNQGGFPTGPGQGQYQNAYGNMGGANPYQNQNYPGRDSPSPPNPGPNSFPPNRGYVPGQNSGSVDPNMGYGGNQDNFGPKVGPGPGQYQNAYAHPQQNQNVPGRDFPPPPPNF